ncbi:MAG: hypothetical protein CMH54_14725 [Myxococcales bacterium]|nr:hypothetical protein [Myxococcales bacterium]
MNRHGKKMNTPDRDQNPNESHILKDNLWVPVRKRMGGLMLKTVLTSLTRSTGMAPFAYPKVHGLERIRNISYRNTGKQYHKLDVTRPIKRKGPLPIVLYIHGGAFRMLSKETHWVITLAYGRDDYVVFNINYRLAPQHKFPAAIEDACHALTWVIQNASKYGGDTSRIVLAGESAGANLVTSLAVAASYPQPEPWARTIFDANPQIRAVVPACGILQVSNTERLVQSEKLPNWIKDRVLSTSEGYLPDPHCAPGEHPLADPLVVIEENLQPERPLPPFFIPVGTRDPLLDDTRRLGAALDAHGVPNETAYYDGEVHAFHAMMWKKGARQCWRDTFAFLNRFVPR